MTIRSRTGDIESRKRVVARILPELDLTKSPEGLEVELLKLKENFLASSSISSDMKVIELELRQARRNLSTIEEDFDSKNLEVATRVRSKTNQAREFVIKQIIKMSKDYLTKLDIKRLMDSIFLSKYLKLKPNEKLSKLYESMSGDSPLDNPIQILQQFISLIPTNAEN